MTFVDCLAEAEIDFNNDLEDETDTRHQINRNLEGLDIIEDNIQGFYIVTYIFMPSTIMDS